jgi:hypothetical protein
LSALWNKILGKKKESTDTEALTPEGTKQEAQ